MALTSEGYSESASYSEATVAKEPGQIERLIMEMRGALDDNQKTIEVLRRSLASVLRPDENVSALRDGGSPHPLRSPLSEQLASIVDGVQTSTRLLHGIMSELDL